MRTYLENIGNIPVVVGQSTPVLYFNEEGRLEAGDVINASEKNVNMILGAKEIESLSCITKKGFRCVMVSKILGTINNDDGFGG